MVGQPQLAKPGSTSSMQAAVDQLHLEKRREEEEELVKKSDSGLRTPPSRPLTPPPVAATEAQLPYNITPKTTPNLVALATSTPEVASAPQLQPTDLRTQETVQREEQELDQEVSAVTTTMNDSLLQNLESPAASSIGRVMRRIASSQSTTAQSAPSPISSSLNLSLSPEARREIGAAFNQMKEAVRKDSTTTTASGDSTQTELNPPVHLSGRPASTTAGPTAATPSRVDSATQEVRGPVKQVASSSPCRSSTKLIECHSRTSTT